MPYQQGYYDAQDQYAGYQGYAQAAQTHVYQANSPYYQTQHPMVVIPSQQPRHEVSYYQPSPDPYQFHGQSEYYQQPSAQYETPLQQQHYFPQQQRSQPQINVSQQSVQYPQQPTYQAPYQSSRSQPVYHQPVRQQSTQESPQYQYQQSPIPHDQDYSHLYPPQRPVSQSGTSTFPYGPQPFVQQHTSTSLMRPQVQPPPPRPQQRNHQQPRPPNPTYSSQQQPSQARVVAHVEIPVYKPAISEMPPSPKRRRSNDGHAIPIKAEPPQAERNPLQPAKHVVASSSHLTELNSSQLPPTPQPSVDYQALLIALADDYINAAYSMSSAIASGNASEEDQDEYCGLISTAMGCLESVLSNYRLSDPRKEARIRLRLASLLVEETENDEEAEEVLSKGIALCDRNRLLDLKYAMQHLSTRLVFKRNPKAALKSVDRLVRELETLKLFHWVYAFRFLRVALSLQLGSHSECAAALKHLNALNTLADDQRDISVLIVAATLEAIVHLRSGSVDAVDLTQRAMATARTHQLGPEMQRMPQFRGLLDCLDLTCSLLQFNPDQATARLQQMQNNLDTGTRDAGWSKDGSLAVELGATDNKALDQDTCGMIRSTNDGRAALILRWITRSQLYALGFLLSGLTKLHQHSSDGTAGQFLSEGLKLTEIAPDAIRQSLPASAAGVEHHQNLSAAMRLYKIFAACNRSDWDSARKGIQDVRREFSNVGSEVDEPTHRMLLYLEGLCRQGLGELRAALELYGSPILTFQPETKTSNMEKDLRALAALNSVFILRTLGAEEYVKADSLLTAVEPYCLHHTSKALLAVYHIIKATAVDSNNNIIKTKQYIQLAVQTSKAASNNQLLCVVMNLMTDKFFNNTIVGEQAEAAARTGRSLAKKSRSKLWTAVADDMYGNIMERCGKAAESEAARREAQGILPDLPESLKSTL